MDRTATWRSTCERSLVQLVNDKFDSLLAEQHFAENGLDRVILATGRGSSALYRFFGMRVFLDAYHTTSGWTTSRGKLIELRFFRDHP